MEASENSSCMAASSSFSFLSGFYADEGQRKTYMTSLAEKP